MSARARATALLCASALAAACGGAPRATASTSAAPAPEPSWRDVLDTTPELLIVVHPAALRRDKVYGQLLRRAIELARARSPTVTATRTIDAIEDADEVIVGVRRVRSLQGDPQGAAGDGIAVVLGAPADVDPAKLVDVDGRALWAPGPVGPCEAVRELVQASASGAPADDAAGASLFELPGRTWVIASGPWRAHARAALAHPADRSGRRPGPPIADGALAYVRFDGPSLVDGLGPQVHGAVASLGRHLLSATLELTPGAEHEVRATLAYADDDAAATAELRGHEIIGAIARTRPRGLSWLAAATVERAATRVVVAAALPPALVGALMHAGAANLDADAPGGAPLR